MSPREKKNKNNIKSSKGFSETAVQREGDGIGVMKGGGQAKDMCLY